MKRAVTWTSTGWKSAVWSMSTEKSAVASTSTGWKSAVWSTSTEKSAVASTSTVDGQHQPNKKCIFKF